MYLNIESVGIFLSILVYSISIHSSRSSRVVSSYLAVASPLNDELPMQFPLISPGFFDAVEKGGVT